MTLALTRAGLHATGSLVGVEPSPEVSYTFKRLRHIGGAVGHISPSANHADPRRLSLQLKLQGKNLKPIKKENQPKKPL